MKIEISFLLCTLRCRKTYPKAECRCSFFVFFVFIFLFFWILLRTAMSRQRRVSYGCRKQSCQHSNSYKTTYNNTHSNERTKKKTITPSSFSHPRKSLHHTKTPSPSNGSNRHSRFHQSVQLCIEEQQQQNSTRRSTITKLTAGKPNGVWLNTGRPSGLGGGGFVVLSPFFFSLSPTLLPLLLHQNRTSGKTVKLPSVRCSGEARE